MSSCEIGCKSDAASRLGKCPVELAVPPESNCKIDVGFRIFVVQLNCPPCDF